MAKKTVADYTPDWAVPGALVDYVTSIGMSRMPAVQKTVSHVTPAGRLVLEGVPGTFKLAAAGYYERIEKSGNLRRRITVARAAEKNAK